MKSISLLNLYLIFVKIGAILLGGGYVILPIVINEFSDKRNLVEKDTIVDYFALAQSLPGIIAANISMFIGYKLRRKTGALIAMLGVITVPFFVIILLGSLIGLFAENQYLQAMLWGVGIAVIALILLTIREMWQLSERNIFFYLIFIVSLVLLVFLNLSPIKTILMVIPLGILYKYVTDLRRNE